jgi:hypothetical protein
MTELHDLLESAVAPLVGVDVTVDLLRGHQALSRRRRTFVVGVAAAVLAVGGVTAAYTRPAALHLQPAHHADAPIRAGAFEIPPPPAGWSVQAADESLVVIAPDGLPKVDLHDPQLNLQLMGKLSIQLMSGSAANGTPVPFDGRTFYDNDHAGGHARLVSVQAPSGGVLVLEEAPRLHWTTQQMVEYLDQVVVLPSGVPASD